MRLIHVCLTRKRPSYRPVRPPCNRPCITFIVIIIIINLILLLSYIQKLTFLAHSSGCLNTIPANSLVMRVLFMCQFVAQAKCFALSFFAILQNGNFNTVKSESSMIAWIWMDSIVVSLLIKRRYKSLLMHPNQYWCHRDVHFFHSAPTTWFSNLALFNRVILRRTRPLEELLTFSVSGTWQIKVAEVQNRENKEVALAFYPDSCWAPTRPDAGWSGSALIKYIRAVWWLHQYPVGFNDLSTLKMIIISFPHNSMS